MALPGTTGPSLNSLPGGFSSTNAPLEYTINAADLGKKVTLTFAIERSFTGPPGEFINRSIINGTMTLPNIANALATGPRLRTADEKEGDASAAVANTGTFQFNGMDNAFADADETKYTEPGGTDKFVQTFSVTFDFTNVEAIGDDNLIRIDLRGSADSLKSAVPPT